MSEISHLYSSLSYGLIAESIFSSGSHNKACDYIYCTNMRAFRKVHLYNIRFSPCVLT